MEKGELRVLEEAIGGIEAVVSELPVEAGLQQVAEAIDSATLEIRQARDGLMVAIVNCLDAQTSELRELRLLAESWCQRLAGRWDL